MVEITFERRLLGPAPALLAWSGDHERSRPAVLWLHGFTADKDTDRHELARLAEAGFVAVGIDLAGHGERKLPAFDAHFVGTPSQVERRFYELVAQTTDEIPSIVDELGAMDLVDDNRLGVTGVSMGGHITYAAVVTEPRIRSAVALLGSPIWPDGKGPMTLPQRFFPTPLLSITTANDEIVAPGAARALHETLQDTYATAPHRLRYLEIPNEPHMMSEKSWLVTIKEMVNWHSRFLLLEATG